MLLVGSIPAALITKDRGGGIDMSKPIIRGGQGRSVEDIKSSAAALAVLVAIAVAAAILYRLTGGG